MFIGEIIFFDVVITLDPSRTRSYFLCINLRIYVEREVCVDCCTFDAIIVGELSYWLLFSFRWNADLFNLQ